MCVPDLAECLLLGLVSIILVMGAAMVARSINNIYQGIKLLFNLFSTLASKASKGLLHRESVCVQGGRKHFACGQGFFY